jgi:N-glycosylase/DNA lyase
MTFTLAILGACYATSVLVSELRVYSQDVPVPIDVMSTPKCIATSSVQMRTTDRN